jgi:translation initiation factor 1
VLDPEDQPVRVRREKRGGKMVTVVCGLSPRSERTSDLPAMLKQLKSTLGAGGTMLEDGFEIQGDHRDRLVEHFKKLGYPAKAAGG